MLVVMSVDPIYNDGAVSTSDIGADQKFVSVERRRQVWTMDNEWLRLAQGGYDGRGQRSCKCNHVDFYKDAPMLTQLGLWLASWLT